MVIPGHAVVSGVLGTSDCSARTAADSWPHSGPVDFSTSQHYTPRAARPAVFGLCDVRRSIAAKLPITLWASPVNCDPHSMVQSGTRYSSTEFCDIVAVQPPRVDLSRQEMIPTSRLNPSTTRNAGKLCKGGRPKRDSAG
jgi:hypothetical protein